MEKSVSYSSRPRLRCMKLGVRCIKLFSSHMVWVASTVVSQPVASQSCAPCGMLPTCSQLVAAMMRCSASSAGLDGTPAVSK